MGPSMLRFVWDAFCLIGIKFLRSASNYSIHGAKCERYYGGNPMTVDQPYKR